MSKRIIVRFVCLLCLTLSLVLGGFFMYGVVLEHYAALECSRANKLYGLEYGSEAWILEATRQAEQGYAYAQHSLGRL